MTAISEHYPALYIVVLEKFVIEQLVPACCTATIVTCSAGWYFGRGCPFVGGLTILCLKATICNVFQLMCGYYSHLFSGV